MAQAGPVCEDAMWIRLEGSEFAFNLLATTSRFTNLPDCRLSLCTHTLFQQKVLHAFS